MKYRKPHRFYIDRHDRLTIEVCKKKYNERLSAVANIGDGESQKQAVVNMLELFVKYQYCLPFWKEKQMAIDKWMLEDEQKDMLLEANFPPPEVHCRSCQEPMTYRDHFFDQNDSLAFIFDCQHNTHPTILIYTDGRVVVKEKRTCPQCGASVQVKTQKEKLQIIINTSCTECNYSDIDTFDTSEKPPIDEQERTKYCFTDEYGTTVERDFENLIQLARLAESLEKEKLDDGLWETISQMQTLTLHQVELLLTKALLSKGYDKLKFDSPQLGTHVKVSFTVQDTQVREPRKSALTVSKIFHKALLQTNWRLVDPQYSVTCRLGIISGTLKAFESEEDFEKLAHQILNKKSRSVNSTSK